MVQRKKQSVRTRGTGKSLLVTLYAYFKYNFETNDQIPGPRDNKDMFLWD